MGVSASAFGRSVEFREDFWWTSFWVFLSIFLVGAPATAQTAVDVVTFHRDRQRTGWSSAETILTPANVSDGTFGPIWNSAPFDSVTIGAVTYAPHLYASPLYVDAAAISTPTYAGTFSAVFAATSNGFVY